MNGKRDCKNCIHKVPVFDEEEGIWRGAECDAWECNFVSREEALKAYEGRPHGEWVIVSRNCWKCSYCQELTNEGKNFCPNCGADMRGGAE